MPALPLGDAGPYVAAAYLVFLALILIYVGIMAGKLARIERQAAELSELAARAQRRDGAGTTGAGDPATAAGAGDSPTAAGASDSPTAAGAGESATKAMRAEPVERS